MHFAFDADQRSFADATNELLADLATPAALRSAWAAEPGSLGRAVWDALGSMGVLDACAPVEVGGLGLDERSIVLVLEAAGRVGLPDPLVETALVAAPLLDSPLAGRMISTDLGGRSAPCAADADALLLLDGDELHLVDRSEIRIEDVPSLDGGRRLGRPRWSPSATTRLDVGPDEIDDARLRGALGTAAELLGLGHTTLDLAVAHAKDRHQFGVAIGTFQAVKHQLADVGKELHFARPLVHRAAHSLATGDGDRAVHVAAAKAAAGRAAELAGRASLQVHGAIGYTVEHDLHLFLKRIWTLVPAWGSPAAHRRRIARALHL